MDGDPNAISEVEDLSRSTFGDLLELYDERMNPSAPSSSEYLKRLPLSEVEFFRTRPKNVETYNLLLRACAAQGDYPQARAVFDRLCVAFAPDVRSYTALIPACAFAGSSEGVELAFDLVGEMKRRGVDRDYHVYGALVRVCTALDELDRGFHVLDVMKADFLTPNEVSSFPLSLCVSYVPVCVYVCIPVSLSV